MANNEKVQFYGTGRRKSSVPRVRLVPGNGQIIINGKDSKDYFCKKTLEMIIRQPLVLTETEGRFDVLVNAHGGGTTGQAGAVRLGIARALLKDAPIVLLDEATASLDVENETKVQGALSRLLVGKTVLVIAHRMRTVEAADKIIVLADGRVAEEGTPAELMNKNGLYHRMVDLQRQSAGWRLN